MLFTSEPCRYFSFPALFVPPFPATELNAYVCSCFVCSLCVYKTSSILNSALRCKYLITFKHIRFAIGFIFLRMPLCSLLACFQLVILQARCVAVSWRILFTTYWKVMVFLSWIPPLLDSISSPFLLYPLFWWVHSLVL